MTMQRFELGLDLSIAGQQGEAMLVSFDAHESLSTPFLYEVDFSCANVDPEAAIGGDFGLRVFRAEDGGERIFRGVIETISIAGVRQDREGAIGYRARVVPAACLPLSYRHGCSIFQNQTAQDIVKAVFRNAGLTDSSADWTAVTRSYEPREYCVQYDESEWDFVNRLLEEEGIYYYFEHSTSGHRMCFVDDKAQVELLSPATIRYVRNPWEYGMRDWNEASQVGLSKATLDEYDFVTFSGDLSDHPLRAERKVKDVFDREHYEWPGRYGTSKTGDQRAEAKLQSLRTTRVLHRGTTDVFWARPGFKFELTEHPSGAEYMIVDSRFSLAAPSASSEETPRVTVELSCMSADEQYRAPQRTPRPFAGGIQTARVTGPIGEEVHTDEHGRVKVQFPWDRQGKGDETTSCYVRVAQGQMTGALMTPRVGWEVIVDFLDGDLDRPLCLGRVWNPQTPPYYPLPDSKTRTSFGSTSSPGRTGVNEILLEDLADSEALKINGQFNTVSHTTRDRTFRAGNHANHNVKECRHIDVKKDEAVVISADHSLNVGQDHEIAVAESRSVSVEGSATSEVGKGYTLRAGGQTIQVGSPMHAMGEVAVGMAVQVATEAAAGVMGAAAGKAASKAEAMLGPLAPALNQARSVVGVAAQFAGPAASLLQGDNAMLQGYAQMAGVFASGAAAQRGAAMATEHLLAQVGGDVAEKARSAITGRSDGDSVEASQGRTGGTGQWSTTVNQDVTETFGLRMNVSLRGETLSVGGNLTETVGAARIEAAKSGFLEITGGAKAETVAALYKVDLTDSMTVSSKVAASIHLAGSHKASIKGGHSLSSGKKCELSAKKMRLVAKESITLTCGRSKIVINKKGVFVDGVTEVKIESKKIETTPSVLGSP